MAREDIIFARASKKNFIFSYKYNCACRAYIVKGFYMCSRCFCEHRKHVATIYGKFQLNIQAFLSTLTLNLFIQRMLRDLIVFRKAAALGISNSVCARSIRRATAFVRALRLPDIFFGTSTQFRLS